MPTMSIQMHLNRNPCLLQRSIVNQRVRYIVHRIVRRLQQKRRRRPTGDRDGRIQLKISRSILQHMPRIKSNRKIWPTAFFVCGISSWVQTLLKCVLIAATKMPAR